MVARAWRPRAKAARRGRARGALHFLRTAGVLRGSPAARGGSAHGATIACEGRGEAPW